MLVYFNLELYTLFNKKIMQCVILAGGKGSRISEETFDKPKPLIKICEKPILIHIIDIYKKFGVEEFIICLGYKGEKIKEYFLNYDFYENDFEIDFKENSKKLHKNKKKGFKITLVDTGQIQIQGKGLKKLKNI